jgi:uncharacterized membrane protein
VVAADSAAAVVVLAAAAQAGAGEMSILMKNILSKKELHDLAAVITKAEKTTSGEIRVVLRHKRRLKEKHLSVHDLALNEFYNLGMEKTRDKTGVLIFLLLSERVFHIAADEGIHAKVSEGTWDVIAEKMSHHFKQGKFFDGIVDAINKVASELSKYFPRKPDDTDELSNEIIEN